MKITTQKLIQDLRQRTEIIIAKAEKLNDIPLEKLNYKLNKEKWSALECIQHLNLYGDYYNPTINKSIENNTSKPSTSYQSGFLGNYFYNSMLPKEKLNTMKTFADKNPNGSHLKIDVLEKFLKQQKEFLDLLDKSNQINISKTRIAITISKFIRLKLGDTFLFSVAHNERHILQAEKAIR